MLQELPTLTPGQYSLVFNMFSFTIATMAAAFVFFVMAQKNLAPTGTWTGCLPSPCSLLNSCS
jgi:hypothetical protein